MKASYIFILFIIPFILSADSVPDLDYYWQTKETMKIGFGGGIRENAPCFNVELLFPLNNFVVRPGFSITLKDDEEISWYYPVFDILFNIYGNHRTNKRFYMGAGGHIGIPIKHEYTEVGFNYGGQAFLGFDYTLSFRTSLFIELGAQGSKYKINDDDKDHVGVLGLVGFRMNL